MLRGEVQRFGIEFVSKADLNRAPSLGRAGLEKLFLSRLSRNCVLK